VGRLGLKKISVRNHGAEKRGVGCREGETPLGETEHKLRERLGESQEAGKGQKTPGEREFVKWIQRPGSQKKRKMSLSKRGNEGGSSETIWVVTRAW